MPQNVPSFVPPPEPMPRETYDIRRSAFDGPEGKTFLHVQVLKDAAPLRVGDKDVVYVRNHRLFYRTFEPFRQAGRDYALISRHYTGTSVLDLQTGEIIAEEPIDPYGFCPAEFYVPDWHDVHRLRIMPGHPQWKDYMEWPHRGDFGLVAGCVWADDANWKIQYLDLSRITEGIITREERFGYLPLAHRVKLINGVVLDAEYHTIELAVAKWFDLANGKELGVNGERPDKE